MVGEMPHIGTGKVSADLSHRTSLCVIANHQLNTSMHDYHIAMLLPKEWSSCSLRNLLVNRAVALYMSELVIRVVYYHVREKIPKSSKNINTTCT